MIDRNDIGENRVEQRNIVSVSPFVSDLERLPIGLNQSPFGQAGKRSADRIGPIITQNHKGTAGGGQAGAQAQLRAPQIDRAGDICLPIIGSGGVSIEIDLIHGRGGQHQISGTQWTGPGHQAAVDGKDSRRGSDRSAPLQGPDGVAKGPHRQRSASVDCDGCGIRQLVGGTELCCCRGTDDQIPADRIHPCRLAEGERPGSDGCYPGLCVGRGTRQRQCSRTDLGEAPRCCRYGCRHRQIIRRDIEC